MIRAKHELKVEGDSKEKGKYGKGSRHYLDLDIKDMEF